MYGRMLADGRGVAPDLPAAYAWLTRAADSGMADAQVALSMLPSSVNCRRRNFRSAIRASRATLTASRVACRSTAAGLSAADLARAARSSWAFLASAAALRRSAKPVFLDLFIGSS